MKKKIVKGVLGSLVGILLCAQLIVGGVFDSNALFDVSAEAADATSYVTDTEEEEEYEDPDFEIEDGVLSGVKTKSKNIVLPETVTEIESYAIPSYVTSITIPKSVTEIESGAFLNATSLKTIKVAKANKKYAAFGDCLYTKNKTSLLAVPAKLTKFKFPAKLKTIESYAFSYNKAKAITLPKSVKKIKTNAFYYCGKLEKLTIDKNATTISNGFAAGRNVSWVASTCGMGSSKKGYLTIYTQEGSKAYKVAKKMGILVETID